MFKIKYKIKNSERCDGFYCLFIQKIIRVHGSGPIPVTFPYLGLVRNSTVTLPLQGDTLTIVFHRTCCFLSFSPPVPLKRKAVDESNLQNSTMYQGK